MDLILTSLEVQNFRSLRNIKLEFDQEKQYLRLFIDKNDAGKSNILRAIRLVLSSERLDSCR
ncbi:MAG TPA: ATP-binding protein [Syntrophomonadaceae bacterium]|nr:ATP-binding protein [Syntrophomonadaceae bacterium]